MTSKPGERFMKFAFNALILQPVLLNTMQSMRPLRLQDHVGESVIPLVSASTAWHGSSIEYRS